MKHPAVKPKFSQLLFGRFTFVTGIAFAACAVIDSVLGMNFKDIVLELWLAWFLADFASGVIHWFFDTYFYETTPVLGPIVYDHRQHHVSPNDVIEMEASMVSPINFLVIGIFTSICFFMGSNLFWPAFFTFANLSPMFHRWAHVRARKEKLNPVILLLQDFRIILPAEDHNKHHKLPRRSNYCIMSGLMNPVLDRTYFWKGIEKALSKVGVYPTAEEALREEIINSSK